MAHSRATLGPMDQDDVIDRLLRTPGHWAVLGLSTRTDRPAYEVSAYLQQLGHDITPVHPSAPTVHGRTGYATLAQVPGPIDVVDLFVASHRVGPLVDEAIARRAGAVWFQLGVVDEAAAARARDAGLDVVTGTCPAIEGRRRGLVRADRGADRPVR